MTDDIRTPTLRCVVSDGVRGRAGEGTAYFVVAIVMDMVASTVQFECGFLSNFSGVFPPNMYS
jgi:hypothetical protein